jgi:putative methionine-R-sulfoxide reductase with GAF domain
MERYSILDQGSHQATSDNRPSNGDRPISPTPVRERLRFPAEDGGKSLSEMAQRDLDATLQLLTERAQYITGASGAAIALREGDQMICRASAGPSAPELGAQVQMNSGLSGESVRTRQILRCDNAETDPRVNQESCRILGIVSVVVMPLLREQEVHGVFELLSDRAYAFEERDLAALARLAQIIQTAIDHAEAAGRAQAEIRTTVEFPAAEPGTEGLPAELSLKAEAKPEVEREVEEQSETVVLPEHGNVGKCEACGFPVSEGRKLCLDCEGTEREKQPELLAQFAGRQPSWVRSHVYLVGAVLVAVLTVVVLVSMR